MLVGRLLLRLDERGGHFALRLGLRLELLVVVVVVVVHHGREGLERGRIIDPLTSGGRYRFAILWRRRNKSGRRSCIYKKVVLAGESRSR